jgi:hypothetical protein
MKKLNLILALILFVFNANAQVQWAKQIYSSSTTFGEYGRIISDGTNTYMIGEFGGNLFLQNDTLFASGTNDIFIAKFDAAGNNLWSKNIGGNSSSTMDSENANAVYDPINNCIYLSGHFVDNFYFPGVGYITGNSDIFLAKMDLDGNFIWAKKAGGNGHDRAQVYVNPYGKIYLTSQSTDSAHFDNFHIGAGGAIVTYDPNGNCLSAEVKYNTNIFNEYNYVGLSFRSRDVIYFGTFISNIFNIDTVSISSIGAYDGFIALADSTGKIAWSHHLAGMGDDLMIGITVFNDDLFITGRFTDTINFSGQDIYNIGNDIFIAKISGLGNLVWFKNFTLNSNDAVAGSAIDINSNGNLILSGRFNGVANIGTNSYQANTDMDAFLAKFDTSGTCLSFFSFGQTLVNSMALDNNNNVYLNGNFSNPVSIGIYNFSLLGSGSDIYLAKFNASLGNNTRTAPNNTLIIYANPNKGTCNITIPDDLKSSPNLTLMIYNAQGSLIQKQQIQQLQDKVKLSLDAEAKGMYNVTLSDGYKIYYGKIVFE